MSLEAAAVELHRAYRSLGRLLVLDDLQVRVELLAAAAKVFSAITTHGSTAIDAEQRERRRQFEVWLATASLPVTEHPVHQAGVPLARIRTRASESQPDVTDLIDYLDHLADLYSRAREEIRRLGL